MRGYSIVHRPGKAIVDERAEVVAGLIAAPAMIAPGYFYDELAARSTARSAASSTTLTRTEIAIFREPQRSPRPWARVASSIYAGDCCKAEA